MSDQSLGPGWWEASDDKWYPPETHPSSVWPTVVPRVAPADSKPLGTRAERDPRHRRGYVRILPVVVACLVIAIVLPLTLGSSSHPSSSLHSAGSTGRSTSIPPSNTGANDTTTSAPRSNVGGTDLTGTYVGVDEGTSLTMLLVLTQSGSSLTGTLIENGSHYPPTLGDEPARVTGSVDLATNTFIGSAPTFALSFKGNVSGSSLTLFFGNMGGHPVDYKLAVVFHRGTASEFDRLIHKSTPSVANPQVNLVNAVAAAKTLYRVKQTYSYELGAVSEHAPEFIWTAKPCKAVPVNCISYRILDVSSRSDSQGIALAVYSPATSACWYAIDIEKAPRVVSNDLSAFVRNPSDPNASVTQSGVYYARSPVGGEPSYCMASDVLYSHSVTWGSDYATAGALR